MINITKFPYSKYIKNSQMSIIREESPFFKWKKKMKEPFQQKYMWIKRKCTQTDVILLVIRNFKLKLQGRKFLVVQWLRLWTSNVAGMSSIPGWGTKSSHAAQSSQEIKNNKIVKNKIKLHFLKSHKASYLLKKEQKMARDHISLLERQKLKILTILLATVWRSSNSFFQLLIYLFI